mgnify:CR=1 FL=1
MRLFLANLDNRRSVDFENDGAGGLLEVVKQQSTETTGAEIITRWNMTDEVILEGNVTYQDAEFSEGANVGKQPRRQPEFSGNLAVSYNNGFVDARLGLSYSVMLTLTTITQLSLIATQLRL